MKQLIFFITLSCQILAMDTQSLRLTDESLYPEFESTPQVTLLTHLKQLIAESDDIETTVQTFIQDYSFVPSADIDALLPELVSSLRAESAAQSPQARSRARAQTRLIYQKLTWKKGIRSCPSSPEARKKAPQMGSRSRTTSPRTSPRLRRRGPSQQGSPVVGLRGSAEDGRGWRQPALSGLSSSRDSSPTMPLRKRAETITGYQGKKSPRQQRSVRGGRSLKERKK